MSIVNLAIKFENITTPGYGEDMKLKPGIKRCATLELKHCGAGNVSMKRVRGDLFNYSLCPRNVDKSVDSGSGDLINCM